MREKRRVTLVSLMMNLRREIINFFSQNRRLLLKVTSDDDFSKRHARFTRAQTPMKNVY